MGESTKPLAGRVAIVTGGGRDIGRAVAERLAKDGKHLKRAVGLGLGGVERLSNSLRCVALREGIGTARVVLDVAEHIGRGSSRRPLARRDLAATLGFDRVFGRLGPGPPPPGPPGRPGRSLAGPQAGTPGPPQGGGAAGGGAVGVGWGGWGGGGGGGGKGKNP